MDRRPLALGVGVLGLLLAWLVWPTTDPRGAPGPEPAPTGVDAVRRVVRPVPAGSTAAPDPESPAQEGLAAAMALLAEEAGGYVLDCPAPAGLPEPLEGAGLRRPVVRGGRLSAVVDRPEGGSGLRWDGEGELVGCAAFDVGDTDCAEARRMVSDGSRDVLAIVTWSGGSDGRASCAIRPPGDARIAGRLERGDGEPLGPGVRLMGCGTLQRDGDRFAGTAPEGLPCNLFAYDPGSSAGAMLEVVPLGTMDGLLLTLTPHFRLAPSEARRTFDAAEQAMADRAVEETPEVRVLARPDLSPEVRAIVHGWVEHDLAIAARRLEITRELNEIVAPRER